MQFMTGVDYVRDNVLSGGQYPKINPDRANSTPTRSGVCVCVCMCVVQTLVSSRLDYCNALLTGLPACVMKPLQMIQNAAARLVFNPTKRAPVTPLLIDLHWLPVAARIKFKSLMLAYRVLDGSARTYLNANVTPRMLRSSSERRLALPSVQARQSRLFSFVVPRW